MDNYSILPQKKGIELLQKAWSVFLSPHQDFWPDPKSNKSLRYRSFFQPRVEGVELKLQIFLHLTDAEIEENPDLKEVLNTSGSNKGKGLFFYGAQNDVEVLQLRVTGTLRALDNEERKRVRKLLLDRILGLSSKDRLPIKPQAEEAEATKVKLKKGRLYCFEATKFESQIFNRA